MATISAGKIKYHQDKIAYYKKRAQYASTADKKAWAEEKISYHLDKLRYHGVLPPIDNANNSHEQKLIDDQMQKLTARKNELRLKTL